MRPPSDAQAFALAPMDRRVTALTCVVLPLPLVFLAICCKVPPVPVARVATVATTLLLSVAWVAIWVWGRPTCFELSAAGLRVVWPMRERHIAARALRGAERLTRSEFRERYGWGMRVGAGGLWGAFGILVTPKQNFGLYVSRTDVLVLVRLADDRPLLITPAEPERFVAELNALSSR